MRRNKLYEGIIHEYLQRLDGEDVLSIIREQIDKYDKGDVIRKSERDKVATQIRNETKEEIDKYKIELQRRISSPDKIINGAVYGGISKCYWDKYNGLIEVDGWLLPRCNYTHVFVEQEGQILGEAILDQRREDVYRKYPEFNEKKSGFMFHLQTKDLCYTKIRIMAFSGSKLVKSLEGELEEHEILYRDIRILNKNEIIKNAEDSIESHKRNTLLSESFLTISRELFYCGISKCLYDVNKSVLSVNGWCLPKVNYDEVIVKHIDGRMIGRAELRDYRPDVYKSYMVFNDAFSGFVLNKTLELSEDAVCVEISKETRIVWKREIPVQYGNVTASTLDLNLEERKGRVPERLTIKSLDSIIDINPKIIMDTWEKLCKIQEESSKSLENIEVEVVNENGTTKKAMGTANKEYVNHKLLTEVLCTEPEKQDFYNNYMKTNFLRVQDDFSFLKEYSNTLCENEKRVLSIGAIPPLLEIMLREKFSSIKITVLDPNASDFHTCFKEKSINYIEGSVNDLAEMVFNEKYDLIVMAEVIEHLQINIYELIKNLHGLLNDDGELFITTPNLCSISGIYGLIRKASGLATKYNENVLDQYKRMSFNGYYGHIREYTSREIITMFCSDRMFSLSQLQLYPGYSKNDFINMLECEFISYGSNAKYLFRKCKILDC